jgi:high affinity sulfate transporter 1
MNQAQATNSVQPAWWHTVLPVLQWAPEYQIKWLGFDMLAGITLAAYSIPVSFAYAALAGLPPQTGIYCYLVGGIGYLLLGSCRHLAFGPTSAISLVIGSSLAHLAGGAGQTASLVMTVTVFTAAIFVVAWLFRLSVFVNFISDSILAGFKAGAALSIAITQFPKLLGVKGGGDEFFERVWLLARQLGDTNLVVLAVGLSAVALLVLGDRLFPGRPVALVVVILSLVAVPSFHLTQHGVSVVGELPSGLPAFSAGLFNYGNMDVEARRSLIGLAFGCFLLSYIESISAARTFAMRHRYEVDARQELLGLGAANLIAAFFRGYPSAGGLSQSAVNEKAGARTPLSLVFASLTLGLVLLYLTGLFRNLPNAVLAAVVLVAVNSLINIRELRHLFKVSRLDFTAAMVALVGVLLLGILDGIILAVVGSLLMLLQRTSTPHVAFLGRIPGTNRYTDIARHPDNERLPGLLIFRVEAALLYFNVEHVLRTVLKQVQMEQAGLRMVICDLSNAAYVDVAGARMLSRLYEELKPLHIGLRIVGAHASERDILRAERLDEVAGPIHRDISVADACAELAAVTTNTGRGLERKP